VGNKHQLVRFDHLQHHLRLSQLLPHSPHSHSNRHNQCNYYHHQWQYQERQMSHVRKMSRQFDSRRRIFKLLEYKAQVQVVGTLPNQQRVKKARKMLPDKHNNRLSGRQERPEGGL
jgi:hypothetical protein